MELRDSLRGEPSEKSSEQSDTIRQILLRQCLMPKQMHQPDSANAKREQTDKE
jgi:hypothetical protein